jgi:hypothetical protein
MSRGSSRRSSSTTPPHADSSSTTSPPLHVRVPRHVAWLVTRLIIDYFDYAVRPGASARRTARRVARCRLLRLRRASGCLGMSRGSSLTTSPPSRVQVPRHVARLVTRLIVDYFAYAARPGASARRVARSQLLRLAQARHRLLRLHRASRCLGVGDSPRGPLKQRGNPHLKPATKPKHNLPNPAGNGPHRRDPDGPSRRPS